MSRIWRHRARGLSGGRGCEGLGVRASPSSPEKEWSALDNYDAGCESKTETCGWICKGPLSPGRGGVLTGLLRTIRHWSKWWCSRVEWQ